MLHQINRLLNFALKRGLTPRQDLHYAANRLLAVLGEASFSFEEIDEPSPSADPILEDILDLAVMRSLVEDTPINRDLFDTLIMDCLTPRPAEVARRFAELYEGSPEAATDYFYDLSVSSNYIRKARTDKNIVWSCPSPFGNLEITINVSKPEKDPRDIAAALAAPKAGYPACLLCRENEGFAGNQGHPARQNLRLIPLPLEIARGLGGCGAEWFMQYSPYIYYNEHCIFLNSVHAPMVVDHVALRRLVDILDFLPHYFVGSNADLPIVGGSILTHDHYQGGRRLMPIEGAAVESAFELPGYGDVSVGRLRWPLSTLRLAGRSKERLADLAFHILSAWRGYSDPGADVLAHFEGVPHNAITPVARRAGELYVMDLILRNNRTSLERPYGIFHPHQDVHHIKKENIGLIEAMGLAILPPRLLGELAAIEKALAAGDEALPGPESPDRLAGGIHDDWYLELRRQCQPGADIHQLIRSEVGAKFLRCLLDAGVFKRDEAGLAAFDRFVEHVRSGLGK